MDSSDLTQTLGKSVMDMADAIIQIIETFGLEDVEFGITGIAVEVKGTKDGHSGTGVLMRCSDSRLWVQRGFFLAASEMPLGSGFEAEE